MLTIPKAGWTNVEIGKFKGRASYLTDIPFECLDAFTFALTYNMPMSIWFDAE